MSENKKKKMFNLDNPKAPKGDKIIIKLGEVQPDTLFSNRGHMPIKITNKIIYANKKKEKPVFVSRKIEIKKNGVYASEKIAKNETVEISHTIDFKNVFYLSENHSLSKLFFYNKENNFLIPLGFANIYKVNKDSNVNYFIKNEKVYFVANVKINSGDELTISKQNTFALK